MTTRQIITTIGLLMLIAACKIAHCRETSPPSALNLLMPSVEPIQLYDTTPARRLYCYGVYIKHTGWHLPSHDLEQLTEQCKRRVGIFDCDATEVYSDVEVPLCGDFRTKQVIIPKGDQNLAKRRETGTWVNTGLYIQVWKAIGATGVYKNHDWVVKVDPATVFVPERLRDRIQYIPRPLYTGIMQQNCPYADYSYFGSQKVLSSLAFEILLENLDSNYKCYTEIKWRVGVQGGEPMGEDEFAKICMVKSGVDKVKAFDIITDGACPADRPEDQRQNKKWIPNCAVKTPAIYPFKTPKAWFECLNETMAFG